MVVFEVKGIGQKRSNEYSRKEDGVIWIWILISLIGRLFAQLGR